MNYRTLLLAASIPLAFAAPALAASWQPYEGHEASAPRAIFAEPDEGAATLLSCNAEGKLSAIVAFGSKSFVQSMKANAPYRRTVDVDMVRDGEDEGSSPWTLLPAVDTIHTRSHADAAKIYNATILHQSVSLEVPREGTVTLDLPEVDDVFRAFASTCEITQ